MQTCTDFINLTVTYNGVRMYVDTYLHMNIIVCMHRCTYVVHSKLKHYKQCSINIYHISAMNSMIYDSLLQLCPATTCVATSSYSAHSP